MPGPGAATCFVSPGRWHVYPPHHQWWLLMPWWRAWIPPVERRGSSLGVWGARSPSLLPCQIPGATPGTSAAGGGSRPTAGVQGVRDGLGAHLSPVPLPCLPWGPPFSHVPPLLLGGSPPPSRPKYPPMPQMSPPRNSNHPPSPKSRTPSIQISPPPPLQAPNLLLQTQIPPQH